jgi:DNA-binding MarR family transcriptional regulator
VTVAFGSSSVAPAGPGRRRGRGCGRPAAPASVVDRLEPLGHVRRSREERDRRRVLLDVDPQAVALGWQFFGPLIAAVVGVLAGCTDAELDTVSKVLSAVRDAVAGVRAR